MTGILETLVAGRSLDEVSAERVLVRLTDPALDPVWGAAVLTALRAKGESAAEIRGFARAMRRLARDPALGSPDRPVDIVGTGGDGSKSLNLSTGGAILAAACGVPVIKHGNRSVSSASGAADVLEALGYRLPANPAQAGADLRRVGFTFLFAPIFHPAMRVLAPVRKSLGIRTIFNVLGPLTNPAAPPHSVLGAFSEEVAATMAESLTELAVERVFVVHGAEGWDEATPVGPFVLFEVRPGSVTRLERDPRDAGCARCDPHDLAGGDASYNASRLRDALFGETGPHLDALSLAAGLALEVTGRARTMAEGVERARAAAADGTAGRLTERLVEAGDG